MASRQVEGHQGQHIDAEHEQIEAPLAQQPVRGADLRDHVDEEAQRVIAPVRLAERERLGRKIVHRFDWPRHQEVSAFAERAVERVDELVLVHPGPVADRDVGRRDVEDPTRSAEIHAGCAPSTLPSGWCPRQESNLRPKV